MSDKVQDFAHSISTSIWCVQTWSLAQHTQRWAALSLSVNEKVVHELEKKIGAFVNELRLDIYKNQFKCL